MCQKSSAHIHDKPYPKGTVKRVSEEKESRSPIGKRPGYAFDDYSTVNTTLEASGETVPSAATARTSSL